MSIERVPDGETAERRHARTPPCDLSSLRSARSGEVRDSRDPPRLVGDTRPGDGGKSSGNRGGGEGVWEGKSGPSEACGEPGGEAPEEWPPAVCACPGFEPKGGPSPRGQRAAQDLLRRRAISRSGECLMGRLPREGSL
jgi:hypothetical protein